jgi:xanthine dehydrogenase accessory factor
MREVVKGLEGAVRDGRPVAYAALVETRGSTPQKPGATMLIFADGSQTGTLGGGCVEAEVKRRALQLLGDGRPEIVTFHLDDNYGWDDGLICGGRMKMLIDPVRPGEDAAYYRELARRLDEGRGFTEAVVIDAQASDSEAAGRWLLDESGAVVARRGGENPPRDLVTNLRPLSSRPRPYVVAGVSYLPVLERSRLLVVGAGHVGQKVAELAHDADFDVWVVDDREAYCNADRFPHAERLIVGDIGPTLKELPVGENTFCIIVTRGHHHDEEALHCLATTRARFVGMIGSRRKIRLIFDDLLREGIPSEALARVHAPLGLEIGSQTVPEIAVSIVAELIAHRNLGQVPTQLTRSNVLDESSPRPMIGLVNAQPGPLTEPTP